MYIKMRRTLMMCLLVLMLLSQLTWTAYATEGGSLWDQITETGGDLWDKAKKTVKDKAPGVLDSAKQGVKSAQGAVSGFLEDQQNQFWTRTEQQLAGAGQSTDQPTAESTTEAPSLDSSSTNPAPNQNAIAPADQSTTGASTVQPESKSTIQDESMHNTTDKSVDNSSQTIINIYDHGMIYYYQESDQTASTTDTRDTIVVDGKTYRYVGAEESMEDAGQASATTALSGLQEILTVVAIVAVSALVAIVTLILRRRFG